MTSSWPPPSPPTFDGAGQPPVPEGSPPPAPQEPAPSGFVWWWPLAALLGAYAGALVTVTVLAVIFGGTGADEDLPSGISVAATYVQDFLLVGMAVAVATWGGLKVVPASFGVTPVGLRRGLIAAAVGFLAFYVFLLAWSALLDVTQEDDLAADLGAKDSTVALVAVAILVTLVAPIAEEIFFRGFVFGTFRRYMHWGFAVLLAGLVFGGIHAGGSDPVFLVPLGVLGAILCLLYQFTGSLLPSMGVHAFNNALALGVTMDWSMPAVVAGLILAPTIVVTAVAAVTRR